MQSIDFISLFSCDCLTVYAYMGFAGVYLQISRGCGRVPRSGDGSGWARVPFVVYPTSCWVDGFTRLSYFYEGVL